jgi:hypothetical protein
MGRPKNARREVFAFLVYRSSLATILASVRRCLVNLSRDTSADKRSETKSRCRYSRFMSTLVESGATHGQLREPRVHLRDDVDPAVDVPLHRSNKTAITHPRTLRVTAGKGEGLIHEADLSEEGRSVNTNASA